MCVSTTTVRNVRGCVRGVLEACTQCVLEGVRGLYAMCVRGCYCTQCVLVLLLYAVCVSTTTVRNVC